MMARLGPVRRGGRVEGGKGEDAAAHPENLLGACGGGGFLGGVVGLEPCWVWAGPNPGVTPPMGGIRQLITREDGPLIGQVRETFIHN